MEHASIWAKSMEAMESTTASTTHRYPQSTTHEPRQPEYASSISIYTSSFSPSSSSCVRMYRLPRRVYMVSSWLDARDYVSGRITVYWWWCALSISSSSIHLILAFRPCVDSEWMAILTGSHSLVPTHSSKRRTSVCSTDQHTLNCLFVIHIPSVYMVETATAIHAT